MRKNIKMMMTMMIAVCLCATSAVFAADGTRTAASGNWSDGGSWAGGTIASGSGSTAYLTNYIGGTIDTFIDTDTTIGNITVNDPDGTPNNNDLETGAGFLTLAGGSTLDCATRLNLKCVVKGTEGFTKTGAGLMNIGANSNIISGTVNLNGTGEIILNHPAALTNADVNLTTLVNSRKDQCFTKSITVGNGGLFNVKEGNGPIPVKATTSITVNNGGILGTGLDVAAPTLGQPFDLLSPSIQINHGGKLQIKINNLTIGGSNITVVGSGVSNGGQIEPTVALLTNTAPLTLSGHGANNQGAILMSSGNQTFVVDAPVTLAGNTRVGGYSGGVRNLYLKKDITGTGYLDVWPGGGAADHYVCLYLGGSNTYDGYTKISSDFGGRGRIILESPNALPDDQNLMFYAGGAGRLAELDLNGYTDTIKYFETTGEKGKVIFNSSSTMGKLIVKNPGTYAVVMNNGGQLTIAENVSCDGYTAVRDNCLLLITNGTYWCNLEVLMCHGAGNATVTVEGNGTLENYVLRIADAADDVGVVNLNSGGKISVSAVHVNGADPATGAAFNFNGGTLADGAGLWPVWNATYWLEDAFSNVVKSGGAILEVAVADRVIPGTFYHDADLGGTADGGLTKLGASNLTLSATCTYTGPTIVSNGTLVVNGSIAASSGITLASGATIGGSGTIGALTVPNGATIAPGNSIGTLSSGSVTMEAGSEYDWEVGDPVSADLLDVTGTFSIPAGGMTVNAIKDGAPNGTYTLVQTTGGIIGNVNNVTMNYTGGITGDAHPTINGNNLEVFVIPEPAALGLLAILGLAFLRRK